MASGAVHRPLPFEDVANIHRRALATVLLLSERYRTVGHQTSRLFESIVHGCLPLTPADTARAERFTPPSLHVHSADEVVDRIRWIESIAGTEEHAALIRDCLDLLDPYRSSRQAAALIAVLHDLAGADRPVSARRC